MFNISIGETRKVPRSSRNISHNPTIQRQPLLAFYLASFWYFSILCTQWIWYWISWFLRGLYGKIFPRSPAVNIIFNSYKIVYHINTLCLMILSLLEFVSICFFSFKCIWRVQSLSACDYEMKSQLPELPYCNDFKTQFTGLQEFNTPQISPFFSWESLKVPSHMCLRTGLLKLFCSNALSLVPQHSFSLLSLGSRALLSLAEEGACQPILILWSFPWLPQQCFTDLRTRVTYSYTEMYVSEIPRIRHYLQ